MLVAMPAGEDVSQPQDAPPACCSSAMLGSLPPGFSLFKLQHSSVLPDHLHAISSGCSSRASTFHALPADFAENAGPLGYVASPSVQQAGGPQQVGQQHSSERPLVLDVLLPHHWQGRPVCLRHPHFACCIRSSTSLQIGSFSCPPPPPPITHHHPPTHLSTMSYAPTAPSNACGTSRSTSSILSDLTCR